MECTTGMLRGLSGMFQRIEGMIQISAEKNEEG
jgi:hypothetical protein